MSYRDDVIEEYRAYLWHRFTSAGAAVAISAAGIGMLAWLIVGGLLR